MKIALIGEFSGLHSGLKYGLEQLGHRVDIYSNGDGFKKISSDKILYPYSSGFFKRLWSMLFTVPGLLRSISRNYDAVQIINPHVLHSIKSNPWYYGWLIKCLSKGRAVKSLAVAGCEHNTQRGLSTMMRSPCPGCLREMNKEKCPLTSNNSKKIMQLAEDLSDCIIPFGGPSYAQSYQYHSKCTQLLSFPVNVDSIRRRDNALDGKIKVLHGLNRSGFKGSEVIIKALNKIQKDYPQQFEIIFPDRLPFDDYIKLLSGVNVVVDQLYGDALGMNALYSMASSCVVLTSFDPVEVGCLDLTKAPAIQVKSTSEGIYRQIVDMMQWTNSDFIRVGRESREFVLTECSPVKVASQVMKFWFPEEVVVPLGSRSVHPL